MSVPDQKLQVAGQIVIVLLPNGKVLVPQCQVPSREAMIAMCETAKLDLNDTFKQKEAEAAQRLIETPSTGFDPADVPVNRGLRVVG